MPCLSTLKETGWGFTETNLTLVSFMKFNISYPSGVLSGLVKHYWSIENCAPDGVNYTQRIVPSGLSELSFYLCDRPKVTDKNRDFCENSIFSGHLEGYYELLISGHLSLFSISLQPHGAMMFFDIPISEFHNQNVPLKYFLREKAQEMESKLQEAPSFEERKSIAEKFLLDQLKINHKLYELKRISNSIKLINENLGTISIDQLAFDSCLSRKQFERTFLAYVGTTPKQFLKTIRFQNAIHQKGLRNSVSLTELAYDSGYYDQSHMIKEFKLMSGLTPKQYFAQCDPYSDYFQ